MKIRGFLIAIIFLILSFNSFSQILLDGYLAPSFNLIYGYNYEFGKLLRYYWSYEEIYGMFVTKYNYGFNELKHYTWPLSPNLAGVFGVTAKYGRFWANFEYWALSWTYKIGDVYLNNDKPGVLYYFNFWDSNLFPLIHTDNLVNYVGPISFVAEQSCELQNFSLKFGYGKLYLSLALLSSYETENLTFLAKAKYYDIFSNNVSITDDFRNNRKLAFISLGYNASSNKGRFIINYSVGAGVLLNYLRFSNNWIDIDSIKYAITYKSNSEILDILYRGTLAFSGKVVKPSIFCSGSCDLMYGVFKDLYIGTGFMFLVAPDVVMRYRIYYPWGVGMEGVNATTGLVWRPVTATLAILRWEIIKIKASI